jgi:hypothetical protein
MRTHCYEICYDVERVVSVMHGKPIRGHLAPEPGMISLLRLSLSAIRFDDIRGCGSFRAITIRCPNPMAERCITVLPLQKYCRKAHDYPDWAVDSACPYGQPSMWLT